MTYSLVSSDVETASPDITVSTSPVKVLLRCRPPSAGNAVAESGHRLLKLQTAGRPNSVQIQDCLYTLDGVSFAEEENAEEFYDRFVKRSVEDAILGADRTILVYGPTGSGKTHTMFAPEAGIAPLALKQIMRRDDDIWNLLASLAGATVMATCLEILNERISDLLAPPASTPHLSSDKMAAPPHTNLKLQCGKVMGARTVSASEPGKLLELIGPALQRRTTAATKLNEASSRSHCIFQFDIRPTGGRLTLVDLAGSECIGRSGASDSNAKQAGNINHGLLVLRRVVDALASRQQYVPFRDSKLTQLLQESLIGSVGASGARTLMVLCASPCPEDVHETIVTLQYGATARTIVSQSSERRKAGQASAKKDTEILTQQLRAKDAFIQQLRAQNAYMCARLAALEAKQQTGVIQFDVARQDTSSTAWSEGSPSPSFTGETSQPWYGEGFTDEDTVSETEFGSLDGYTISPSRRPGSSSPASSEMSSTGDADAVPRQAMRARCPRRPFQLTADLQASQNTEAESTAGAGRPEGGSESTDSVAKSSDDSRTEGGNEGLSVALLVGTDESSDGESHSGVQRLLEGPASKSCSPAKHEVGTEKERPVSEVPRSAMVISKVNKYEKQNLLQAVTRSRRAASLAGRHSTAFRGRASMQEFERERNRAWRSISEPLDFLASTPGEVTGTAGTCLAGGTSPSCHPSVDTGTRALAAGDPKSQPRPGEFCQAHETSKKPWPLDVSKACKEDFSSPGGGSTEEVHTLLVGGATCENLSCKQCTAIELGSMEAARRGQKLGGSSSENETAHWDDDLLSSAGWDIGPKNLPDPILLDSNPGWKLGVGSPPRSSSTLTMSSQGSTRSSLEERPCVLERDRVIGWVPQRGDKKLSKMAVQALKADYRAIRSPYYRGEQERASPTEIDVDYARASALLRLRESAWAAVKGACGCSTNMKVLANEV